jgi:GT2 family glycosyltransferase
MNVAILILNYNGKNLLSSYLNSVVNNKGDAEVWVIDNGSTDDSLDFIRKNFPKVKILAFDKNYGYAKGYNLAVSKIDADLYCFLNNDVRVTSNWVSPMRQLFEAHQHLGFAQPKIISDQDESIFEYAGAAGGQLDLFGFPYCRGRYLNHCDKDLGQYDGPEKVTWASGAALWVRKTSFDMLGGFDEIFFMHFEEIDLCLRGKTLGWMTMCHGNLKVMHLGGGTLAANQSKKLYYNIRNSLLTYSKTIPALPLLLLIIFRLGFDFLLGFYFFLNFKFNHVWNIFKAHNHFFRLLPKTFSNRSKTVMPFRTTSIFIKFLVAKVNSK